MADLTVAKASVSAATDATVVNSVTAGAAITAGQVVYKDTSTLTYKLADSTTTTKADVAGVAISTAEASGQPLSIITDGILTVSAATNAVTVGDFYALSTTGGAICPVSDVTGTTANATFIGIGYSTCSIKIGPLASGKAHTP